MIGIYMIKNKLNNKIYVGQSKDINDRWIRHKSELKHNCHSNFYLQNAWNKYGEDAFVFVILEECNIEDLDVKEIFYIKKYDSLNNGYNLCEGGKGNKGYKHTDDEIEKMRLACNPKIVLQIDKNLNIVKEWMGTSHAAKTLGYSRQNIENCCKMESGHKTAYGYFWFYKDDYDNNNIDWKYYLKEGQDYNPKVKSICSYDINTGEILQIFSSITEAHNKLNICYSSILNCLKGRQSLAKGVAFKYV